MKGHLKNPLRLFISFVASFAAAAIGSLATIPNIPNWYAQLIKPSFNPPNEIFGPVWTVLYALMAVAFYLVWSNNAYRGDKRPAYWLFGIQLVLNALWSITFFGLHAIELSVVVIISLLVTILLCMVYYHPINRLSVALMVPYAAWVLFATVLTISLTSLN